MISNIYLYYVNPVYDMIQGILLFAIAGFCAWNVKLAMEKDDVKKGETNEQN